jgi:hypothetical protein
MAGSFNLATSPSVYVDGRLSGSATCVWRDGIARTFVLSAAHVIDVPAHTPIEWLTLDGDVGGGQTLDSALMWMPSGGGDLDAALVGISDPGPFGKASAYPWASDIVSWADVDALASVVICGRSGPVPATFDRKLAPGQQFSGHRHGRLLQLRYDFSQTQPGDSGGAVISLPEGRLVAMHVAEHTEAGVSYAWAVAADDILIAFRTPFPGFELRP